MFKDLQNHGCVLLSLAISQIALKVLKDAVPSNFIEAKASLVDQEPE
jgi:hypothetical protein